MNIFSNDQVARVRRQASAGAVAAFAIVLGSAVALPVQAGATTDEPTATVRFARAELASGVGVQEVHQRVLREAKRACRNHGVRDLRRLNLQTECRQEMVEKLLAAIDSERLDSFHANWEARRTDPAG